MEDSLLKKCVVEFLEKEVGKPLTALNVSGGKLTKSSEEFFEEVVYPILCENKFKESEIYVKDVDEGTLRSLQISFYFEFGKDAAGRKNYGTFTVLQGYFHNIDDITSKLVFGVGFLQACTRVHDETCKK